MLLFRVSTVSKLSVPRSSLSLVALGATGMRALMHDGRLAGIPSPGRPATRVFGK